MQNIEYMDEFIAEVMEHIQNIETLLLGTDQMKGKNDFIGEVFRAVHSIKGAAGLFGIGTIVTVSHAMENVFSAVRAGEHTMDGNDVDTMLAANDCLRSLVGDIHHCETVDVTDMVKRIDRIMSKKQKSSETEEIYREPAKAVIKLDGYACDMLKSGLQKGHHLFQIQVSMNNVMPSNQNSPIRLFKTVQTVGTFIDSAIDHSLITSFDDVLNVAGAGNKDIYLSVIFSSLLDVGHLSNILNIPSSCIHEMNLIYAGICER